MNAMCYFSPPLWKKGSSQNVCPFFGEIVPACKPAPGALQTDVVPRGAAYRQAAATRTGRNMLGEEPDNAAQLFLLHHQAVKLKNYLKSKGCAGNTGVSCLWALGAFCVN